MSTLEQAERRVAAALRSHRYCRSRYIAARNTLLAAIAERDTLRNADTDGMVMTCEHGHVACGIGGPACTEAQS